MTAQAGASRSSRVTIVQMESSEDKDDNLRRARRFMTEAKGEGARLVVFPEFLMAFSPDEQSPRQLANMAEQVDGSFVTSLRGCARQNGVYALATIYEKSAVRDRVYDTAVLIGPQGELLGRYRKLHLYDAFGFKESDKFVPGDGILPPVRTKFGRTGIMMCYDVRFPEQSRLLALDGAQIILLPAGWVFGPMKEDHWFTMLKARAIENGVYIVAAAQAGNIYTGRSALIDPFGIVRSDLGRGEKLHTTEIDLRRVKEARLSLPLLANRRADAYRLTVEHSS